MSKTEAVCAVNHGEGGCPGYPYGKSHEGQVVVAQGNSNTADSNPVMISGGARLVNDPTGEHTLVELKTDYMEVLVCDRVCRDKIDELSSDVTFGFVGITILLAIIGSVIIWRR